MAIIRGNAGESFVNDGSTVLYQLHCSFINSCGYCVSLHGSISDYFPLPFHGRCRCWVTALPPGATAFSFPDYRELIRKLDQQKQKTAITKSVLDLINAEVITLEEAVTPNRAKTLAEIVQAKGLTKEQLVAAGVDSKVAEIATNAPKISEEQALRDHQASQQRKLDNAAINREQARDGLGSPRTTARAPANTPPPNDQGVPSATPEQAIRAARRVVDRLERASGLPPAMIPRLSDAKAVQDWVNGTYAADAVAGLSHVDWAVLFAIAEAQDQLERLFKRLRIDRDKAMKEILK